MKKTCSSLHILFHEMALCLWKSSVKALLSFSPLKLSFFLYLLSIGSGLRCIIDDSLTWGPGNACNEKSVVSLTKMDVQKKHKINIGSSKYLKTLQIRTWFLYFSIEQKRFVFFAFKYKIKWTIVHWTCSSAVVNELIVSFFVGSVSEEFVHGALSSNTFDSDVSAENPASHVQHTCHRLKSRSIQRLMRNQVREGIH